MNHISIAAVLCALAHLLGSCAGEPAAAKTQEPRAVESRSDRAPAPIAHDTRDAISSSAKKGR